MLLLLLLRLKAAAIATPYGTLLSPVVILLNSNCECHILFYIQGAKVSLPLTSFPPQNTKNFTNTQRSIVQKENLGHTKSDQFNIPQISSEIRKGILHGFPNLVSLHLFKFSQILFHYCLFLKSLLLSEIPLDIKKSIFEDVVCSADFFS